MANPPKAAKPPKAFDVWFVAANTVYREVPYQVAADWTQQGRLAPADMLRPAGSQDPWKRVAEWALLADYIPRPARPAAPVAAVAAPADAAATAPADIHDPADVESWPRRKRDDDDDVDMIPLIDISMVLLVFFIIISATGALSPVDVPDMHFAGELAKDADAITVSVEKASDEDVYYGVRDGAAGPKPEHAKLPTPEAAVAAVDQLLAGRTRPPEVRIACAKGLPSERVFELARELKKRKEKGMINSFVATVNEAPQK